jgi:transcriptional regulator with XRE-family HTH domain
MSIGDRLRKERKAQGFTQDTLAVAAGVSQTTINDLENGDTQRPRGDTLMALARVLQISPGWLMTGKGEKKMIYAATPHQETMLVLMRRMPLAAQEQLLAIARTFDDSPPSPPGPDMLPDNVTLPRLPGPKKPN